MKFLLEFVSCCRVVRSATHTSEPAPFTEETSSLVPAPSQMRRRKKRGRTGSSRSTSPNSAEWRPSLTSISEDNVVTMDRTAGVDRAVKRKSGQDRARVQVRSHGEDYGRNSFATAIPAFSPTPFMF